MSITSFGHDSAGAPGEGVERMHRSRGIVGILLGLAAGLAFGAGGAIVKPLLESGWSPGAAVFFRVSVAALILLVPGLMALKFDLRPLWRAKWTVLVYSVIAVAGVQLAFYTAIARIPVSTALLIEYLAPVALVAFVWARSRRAPQLVVLAGSVVAIARTRARDRPRRRRPRPVRRRHRGRRDARRRGLLRAGRARRRRRAADRARRGRMPPRRRRPRPRRPHGARAVRGRVRRRRVLRRHRALVGAGADGRRDLDRVRLRGRHPVDPPARHPALVVPRSLRGRLRGHRVVGAARRGDRRRATARRTAHPRRDRARAPRAPRARTGGDRPRRRPRPGAPGRDARHPAPRADAS